VSVSRSLPIVIGAGACAIIIGLSVRIVSDKAKEDHARALEDALTRRLIRHPYPEPLELPVNMPPYLKTEPRMPSFAKDADRAVIAHMKEYALNASSVKWTGKAKMVLISPSLAIIQGRVQAINRFGTRVETPIEGRVILPVILNARFPDGRIQTWRGAAPEGSLRLDDSIVWSLELVNEGPILQSLKIENSVEAFRFNPAWRTLTPQSPSNERQNWSSRTLGAVNTYASDNNWP
jgi:hypothetical protein